MAPNISIRIQWVHRMRLGFICTDHPWVYYTYLPKHHGILETRGLQLPRKSFTSWNTWWGLVWWVGSVGNVVIFVGETILWLKFDMKFDMFFLMLKCFVVDVEDSGLLLCNLSKVGLYGLHN